MIFTSPLQLLIINTAAPWGHWNYNVDRHFLDYHYFKPYLPDLCPKVEKKRRRNIALYILNIELYDHAPVKNPVPMVIEFSILIDSFLVIITIP